MLDLRPGRTTVTYEHEGGGELDDHWLLDSLDETIEHTIEHGRAVGLTGPGEGVVVHLPPWVTMLPRFDEWTRRWAEAGVEVQIDSPGVIVPPVP